MSEWRAGRNPVTFTSEGITLKGNLFLPPDFDPTRTYSGIVVAGTWTSVKEQMSDRYAERLAQQGFVTLDYDFRNYGESDGEPRQYESPALKMVDNRNTVTYLASLPFVDADRIGALGICASAGYMSGTVAGDARVKSLALVAPWLHNAALVQAIYGGEAGVQHRLDLADAARRKYETTGEVDYVPACDPNDPDAAMPYPLDFYLNPARGALPQWTNRFAVMAWRDWLEFDGVAYGAQISAPLLIVHSEAAAVPDGAKAFFGAVQSPKDIFWTQGEQLDFYDQEPQVSKSVAAVRDHFARTL
jgi:fermentation-respiration switch protein FrsA (DUF1100 family)